MPRAVTVKRNIRILGFDPGSCTFGTSVVDVSIKRKTPVCIATETIDASKLFKRSEHKAFIAVRGERDLRIMLIRRELKRIIEKWKPDVIISEAPFLGRKTVTTFEALTEVRVMVRELVWELYPTMRVLFVDPIRVKNYIGVSHIKTDKSDMHKAVHAFYDDRQKNNALSDADEHSIDATAVCHVYYRRDILGEVIEPSKKKKRGKNAGKRTPSRAPRPKSSGGSGRQRSDRNVGSAPRGVCTAVHHGK